MRAILFPGQGSQYIGMGSDFYKKFDSVKKNFSLVDKSLGLSSIKNYIRRSSRKNYSLPKMHSPQS